jgi:hypothetical protein
MLAVWAARHEALRAGRRSFPRSIKGVKCVYGYPRGRADGCTDASSDLRFIAEVNLIPGECSPVRLLAGGRERILSPYARA